MRSRIQWIPALPVGYAFVAQAAGTALALSGVWSWPRSGIGPFRPVDDGGVGGALLQPAAAAALARRHGILMLGLVRSDAASCQRGCRWDSGMVQQTTQPPFAAIACDGRDCGDAANVNGESCTLCLLGMFVAYQ